MANFFFGEGGVMGFNVDRITYVKRDHKKDSIRIYFEKHDSFELKGDMAKQLMVILTRLESEANRAWQAAKPGYLTKSKKVASIETRKQRAS